MGEKLSRETLLEALHEFAAELGETPTRTQMNDEGPYSSTPYENEFGGWTGALKEAGLEPNHENEIDDERLIDELQRLDEELDRVPRFEDMAEHGRFSPHTYIRRWGSWPEAKDAAGLSSTTRTSRRIQDSALLGDVHRLAAELGRPPRQLDVKQYGEYSHRPYYRRWGSWDDVLDAAGLEIDRNPGTPRSKLLGELQRLADELGRPPTGAEMTEHGQFSVWPFLREFQSWNSALRAADLPVNKEHGVVTGHLDYGPNWPDQREQTLRRDGWRCRECGLTMQAHRCIWNGEGLHVHHRTKFRTFESYEEANRLENLVTLCRRCHNRRERNE